MEQSNTNRYPMPRTAGDVEAERAADEAASRGEWGHFMGPDRAGKDGEDPVYMDWQRAVVDSAHQEAARLRIEAESAGQASRARLAKHLGHKS